MEMFEEERVDAIASVPCKASITVIGVHVGCTTAQDAMRMGAVFVRPVQSDGMHRESTGRMAIGSGADIEEQGAAAHVSVEPS